MQMKAKEYRKKNTERENQRKVSSKMEYLSSNLFNTSGNTPDIVNILV